jgi:hypothetical protein
MYGGQAEARYLDPEAVLNRLCERNWRVACNSDCNTHVAAIGVWRCGYIPDTAREHRGGPAQSLLPSAGSAPASWEFRAVTSANVLSGPVEHLL